MKAKIKGFRGVTFELVEPKTLFNYYKSQGNKAPYLFDLLKHTCIVAKNKRGNIIGCISYIDSDFEGQTQCWFYNLYVDELYRNHHVGQCLIQEINTDCEYICCFYKTRLQREFYEYIGFERVDGFYQMARQNKQAIGHKTAKA